MNRNRIRWLKAQSAPRDSVGLSSVTALYRVAADYHKAKTAVSTIYKTRTPGKRPRLPGLSQAIVCQASARDWFGNAVLFGAFTPASMVESCGVPVSLELIPQASPRLHTVSPSVNRLLQETSLPLAS